MTVTYKVDVSREGRYWVAEVEGVPGGATEVRRLSELDDEVRDLVSGLLDVDPDDVAVQYDFRKALGDEAAAAWQVFERERDELYAKRKQFEDDRAAAIRALHDQGVSMRDTAQLVGLSHQRVSQLLDA
ncbi:MerR [Occultella kanbiaonis]|uniref:MerR n=1 Tax=Occultella kanbiaonis TaxID=2675754 RepID=UPI0013D43A18|nr:MerR [Occultella kanbiaonis]